MPKPEEAARQQIDRLLTPSGWVVCDSADANLGAYPGVAMREFPRKQEQRDRDFGVEQNK